MEANFYVFYRLLLSPNVSVRKNWRMVGLFDGAWDIAVRSFPRLSAYLSSSRQRGRQRVGEVCEGGCVTSG